LYNIRATKREKERVSVGIAARVDVLEPYFKKGKILSLVFSISLAFFASRIEREEEGN
jgi:hypothetical protein